MPTGRAGAALEVVVVAYVAFWRPGIAGCTNLFAYGACAVQALGFARPPVPLRLVDISLGAVQHREQSLQIAALGYTAADHADALHHVGVLVALEGEHRTLKHLTRVFAFLVDVIHVFRVLALHGCVGEVGLDDSQNVLERVVESVHHGGGLFQVQQMVIVLGAFHAPALRVPQRLDVLVGAALLDVPVARIERLVLHLELEREAPDRLVRRLAHQLRIDARRLPRPAQSQPLEFLDRLLPACVAVHDALLL